MDELAKRIAALSPPNAIFQQRSAVDVSENPTVAGMAAAAARRIAALPQYPDFLLRLRGKAGDRFSLFRRMAVSEMLVFASHASFLTGHTGLQHFAGVGRNVAFASLTEVTVPAQAIRNVQPMAQYSLGMRRRALAVCQTGRRKRRASRQHYLVGRPHTVPTLLSNRLSPQIGISSRWLENK
jgi:hypothetical protein